jgi:hypothetical protein
MAFGLFLSSLALLSIGALLGWSAKIVLDGINATVVIQTTAVLVTLFLAIWTYRKTKQKEAEARLFTQKATVYEPLIEQLKRQQGAGKPGIAKKFDENEFTRVLFDTQFRAIIWGDEEMIKILAEIGEDVPEGDNQILFGRVAKLYAQIRKELGHRDTKGVGWDIIALNLIPQDRHIARDMKKRAAQGF